MDLAYLRAHPEHLPTFLTHQRIRETPVGGGDVCTSSRLTLDDGTSVFAKRWTSGATPEGFFAVEAAGLRWLRAAGAVPVPEVIMAAPDLLALEWVEPGSPSVAAAERFGRELAALHRAGASAFGANQHGLGAGQPASSADEHDLGADDSGPGADERGLDERGFIGPLTQDNTRSAGPWSAWFAERRLLPYLRISVDRGALPPADAAAVERVVGTIADFGGDEPPARIHGDLWPGNLLWGADGRAWLVDPAAHGGHRETDLAQLALFGGAPHLETILSAYAESWPLADGWRERVGVHQLHLLLVHTAAFGARYADAVAAATRSALRG